MTDTPATDFRQLRDGQRCRIRVWEYASGLRTVHESGTTLYEAPNWTHDGRLLVNADGLLWTLPVDGSGEPTPVVTTELPPVNNDHVLSPDGATIYASADDGRIWAVPLAGGLARRITQDDGALHYLHGVSPGGTRLLYVRLEPQSGAATIHSIGVDGRHDFGVTTHRGPADGSEWTPDGMWILFNTEQFALVPGHAQIARVRSDGSELERLTDDLRVNWFPHMRPDGKEAVYLSYEAGTVGHPADREVELRMVDPEDWRRSSTLVVLRGGQGTINVPSWAPDGSGFAYVDYPLETDVGRTSHPWLMWE